MADKPQYTIPEAADKMGLSPAYVRTLIRKGLLKSTRVPMIEGTLVTHHIITEDAIDVYFGGNSHKTRRKDGRTKFVIYMLETERLKAVALLNANGLSAVTATLRTWNKLKPAAVKPVSNPEEAIGTNPKKSGSRNRRLAVKNEPNPVAS